jgi:hypothetical protein
MVIIAASCLSTAQVSFYSVLLLYTSSLLPVTTTLTVYTVLSLIAHAVLKQLIMAIYGAKFFQSVR